MTDIEIIAIDNKIVEYETEADLIGDFEKLNNRLLKGKVNLADAYKEKKRLESKEHYLKKLSDFIINVRGYLNNCYYKDDENIKEIIKYMGIHIDIIDSKLFFERNKSQELKEIEYYVEAEEVV